MGRGKLKHGEHMGHQYTVLVSSGMGPKNGPEKGNCGGP